MLSKPVVFKVRLFKIHIDLFTNVIFQQGFLNQKGHVWLQLHRPSASSRSKSELIHELHFRRFGVAPHEWEEITDTLTSEENIVKLAKAGDYYQIMKNVGGGGGHELKIRNFKLTIHFQPYFEQQE